MHIWRRIARAIERNDYYMSRLSFSQTKNDYEKLIKMIHKYDNLLSSDTETDSKYLKQVKEELYERN